LITVPSQAYRIELGTRGIDKSKIRVINNGVDFFVKNKQTDAGEIEKRFKVHGKNLVLFVGALEKRKGVEFLIRAVPRISQKIQNVKVIVVGNGSEKITLENLADELDVRNKVLFTGYLKEEDLHALYSMAEVFVLHSLYETFSLVLLEAMTHGKPIVATKILGTTELVKPGFNGILVDPKDSESLADAIVKLLLEGDYAKRLGENGEQLSKNFTWDRAVSEYIAVYNELCVD
jgi:glycogen(starch) synthase